MKLKALSLGIAVLIIGLLFALLYTSIISRSLHEEWHEHLEAGHTQLAEEVSRKRESILAIHAAIGYLSILFAIIDALLIMKFWKT